DLSYNNDHGSKDNGLSRNADRSPKNGYAKDVDEKRSKHERTKSRSERSHRSRSRDRDHHRRRRSKSRERSRRSRSKEKKRSRRSRSRSSSKHHSRSSKHRSSRSRSRDRKRHSSRDRRHRRTPSPPKELPLEERDQRTVFCMQLAARVRQSDIDEFFSNAGKVREVRLIMDNRTRRHKGIAYVEFVDIDSVGRAIALTGTRLCGVPIVVQHSQAEKNRLASMNASQAKQHQRVQVTGPMSLYVGSLHFNVTEEMLRGIFEAFGKVEKIELSRDPETNRSKGYGFVYFKDADDAKKAIEQLNGFELAGRPMKVNYVTERSSSDNHHSHHHHHGALDCDELDRTGIDLGATGRLQLMAKLAEGTGIEFPKAAMTALQMSGQSVTNGSVNVNSGQQKSQVPIATQCFLLSNMFDPRTETNPNWPEEIKNDVIEECRKHGGIVHIYVDPTSNDGHVYVKCASVLSATASVNALHGRWFAEGTVGW
ncbi:RNA-binding protein 39-like protein, partial [Euroglyphus maynei]